MCALVDPPVVWPITFACVSQEVCEGGDWEEPGEGGEPEPPCIPNVGPNGAECAGTDDYWGWSLMVGARIPPHRVQVDPFPRWIVGMGCADAGPYDFGEPGMLTLQDYPAYTPPGLCGPNGPGFSEGCWSDTVAFPERDPGEMNEVGDVRDYQFGLRWRRVDMVDGEDKGPVPATCWYLNERSWNIGQDFGCGMTFDQVCGPTAITHIYETSSYGLENNGPRFLPADEVCPPGVDGCCEQVPSGPGEWDAPAYQVRVPTYWAIEWNLKYEVYELVSSESECQCHGSDAGEGADECTGEAGLCVNEWEHWVWVTTDVYDWVEYEEGWHTIDLRSQGWSTWYATSWSVITSGAGPWCAFEYADPNPGSTVRVPVIEVQSVLRDPCEVYGTCPPAGGGGQEEEPDDPTPEPGTGGPCETDDCWPFP